MLFSVTQQGFFVDDVVRGQWSYKDREDTILQTAQLDRESYGDVETWVEQEPGSGGKESAEATIINLAGFDIRAERPTGDKLTRAKPASAQAEARNIKVLKAHWTKPFLDELHGFTGADGNTDDQVDAFSGAFNKATLIRQHLTNVVLPALMRGAV